MRFLLLLLIPFFVFSQTNTNSQSQKFDSIYYDIAVNVSSENPIKAKYLADSLLVYSSNNKQRIKILMLIADVLDKQEKKGESILKALDALEISKKERDYIWQSRIYGFLSSQYRSIGFIDKGRSFLNEGVEVSNQINDKRKVLKYKAMINHELAEYAFEEKDYYKAIDYLQLAMISYEKEEDPSFKNFVKANVEELIGRSFLCLGKKNLAITHFSRANILINKSGSGNSLHAALIYQGLGDSFLHKKKCDSAIIYLNRALGISEKSDNENLKEKVYGSVSKYYAKVNVLDSFIVFSNKYHGILSKNSNHKKQMINSAYNALQVGISTNNNLYYIIIVIIVFLILFFVFFGKIMAMFGITNDNSILITDDNKVRDFVISQKTEIELLERLKEFEASNNFLDKDISLPTLIGQLNTNTRYFRQFLKKNRDTDYNDYINELRIRYILDKLKTDNKYLTYKISYLADECGFSSHSKFSASFKNVTGYTPSDFIRKIKCDNYA